jgi:hypothetical protein
LVPLLDVALGYDTSSRIVEVTSSWALVFLPFSFSVFSLIFYVFSLAFSSCFFFSSASFKRVFFKASLTFSAFSLSYAMSLSRVLSSKPTKASSSNTTPPTASLDLNLSTSSSGTCYGPHSRYQATPQRWAEVHVLSCLGKNMQSGEERSS